MSPDSFRRSGQPRDETPACHLSPHLWTNHFSHRLDDRRPTNWQKMALRSFCSRVHSQGSVAHRSRSDGTYMAYRCARSRHSTAEAVIFAPEQDGNGSDHCERSRSTRIAQRSHEPLHSLLLQCARWIMQRRKGRRRDRDDTGRLTRMIRMIISLVPEVDSINDRGDKERLMSLRCAFSVDESKGAGNFQRKIIF